MPHWAELVFVHPVPLRSVQGAQCTEQKSLAVSCVNAVPGQSGGPSCSRVGKN